MSCTVCTSCTGGVWGLFGVTGTAAAQSPSLCNLAPRSRPPPNPGAIGSAGSVAFGQMSSGCIVGLALALSSDTCWWAVPLHWFQFDVADGCWWTCYETDLGWKSSHLRSSCSQVWNWRACVGGGRDMSGLWRVPQVLHQNHQSPKMSQDVPG